MKTRRDFIKAATAGAGALTLPWVANADNSDSVPPVVSLILEDAQFVVTQAASGSGAVEIQPDYT